MFFRSLCLCVAIICCAGMAAHAAGGTGANTPDGQALFAQNCAACHGDNAAGDRKPSDIGFAFPMPNFTDCSFATREADQDWLASIHRGGRARGFPRAMPAFDTALSDDEMKAIAKFLRSKCAGSPWVRGEFNLPLAMFTEKAFPEDEVLNLTSFATNGPEAITSTTIFEKRIGPTGQLEVNLPFSSIDSGQGVKTGIGDLAVAYKQNVLADVDSGNILSVLGEVVAPTGNYAQGLGQGTFSFETHALFAHLFDNNYFLQGDVYGAYFAGKQLPDELHGNFGLGRIFYEDDGWGRSWTPQVELLTTQPFASGAKLDWDVVPQLQVSLSRRQHVLFSIGERIPLNDRGTQREPMLVAYLIWDWYDGGLFEGW